MDSTTQSYFKNEQALHKYLLIKYAIILLCQNHTTLKRILWSNVVFFRTNQILQVLEPAIKWKPRALDTVIFMTLVSGYPIFKMVNKPQHMP